MTPYNVGFIIYTMNEKMMEKETMSSLYEDLIEGLQQAIDYERGKIKAKKTIWILFLF